MIFKKTKGKKDRDSTPKRESARPVKDVPMTGKVLEAHERHEPARATKRPNEASTASDPVSADLIRRVLAAIEGWKRDNNLSALPPRIAFEQALSILNALDRNFPHQE